MEAILKFNDSIKPQDYQAVQIQLASPEQIVAWSHGEIKTSETINYRTFKPERGGLFCGKIFGPVKDFECVCGKYKRMKHRGIKCDKCGVEVIENKVRRERLGHIRLASPLTHIWFLKGLPSRLANIIDLTLKDLEKVIYFDAYIVIKPGISGLNVCDVIDEKKYQDIVEMDEEFVASMGAEAIKELFDELDIDEMSEKLRDELAETTSETKRKKVVKRLKVVEGFKNSGIDPRNMFLEVIPVISPDLRPLVPLEGGRFATSDLNDLYRRVIHRNNRLRRLIDLNAPDIIVKNEKRMLQEAVDALFDNGRRGRPITGTNKRPLKSLSDSLKGKYGRFRQNLLGKRVDYSGRTVIVVGPHLKLNQCGLPKMMAVELFKPFILQVLLRREKAATIKIAKRMLEEFDPEIWPALDEVIKEHPILLNRAPTLHKLGIQAFEPILVEDKAIQLHPLVCTAFNADFDGDQMAIHVPLTVESQMEAKVLIMATNNVLSPATGKPIMIPTQDMVLGIYWLTKDFPNEKGEGKTFGSVKEVVSAYEHGFVALHAKIRLRIQGEFVETTVGRALLSDILPEDFEFELINKTIKKKGLEDLVDRVFRLAGNVETIRVLDTIKEMGFRFATQAGFSISMSDMTIPTEKETIIKEAYEEVNEIHQQHQDGIITDGERYNKVIDIWSGVTERVAEKMIQTLAKEVLDESGRHQPNSIFVMADSGARSSTSQNKQLGGMRGLMAKPTGEIIETPITANFREGLSVHQYFISTHGARKGLADTALKTARSGYLTRRLVDVAQDCMVTAHDCKTIDGLVMKPLLENGEVIESLGERILGRVLAEPIFDPETDEILFDEGELLTEEKIEKLEKLDAASISEVTIRSVLTCEMPKGVCVMCYGRDLGRGSLVSVGEAVGVIAAQSIGEPGTQLTMRTFHIGGAANRQVEQSAWESNKIGKLSLDSCRSAANREGQTIVMNRNSELVILDAQEREVERRHVPIGTRILKKEGEAIGIGDKIAEWDPFVIPIISDSDGIAKFADIIENESMRMQMDETTGITRKVIIESLEDDFKPRIMLRSLETRRDLKYEDGRPHPGYYLPVRAELAVEEGEAIKVGDVIAKIPRETTKNKDITGGLPRVVDLFEARSPKEPCIISEIDGKVSFGENMKRKRRLIVTPEIGEPKEYLIPKGKHIIVFEEDRVKAGDRLTDGDANPHDIIRVKGIKELQKFLVDEVQEVYRLQGVKINDKHIEVIIRQMLNKVEVVDPGDTSFMIGESVLKNHFNKENEKMDEKGLMKAEAKPQLLGITKASLSTDSFISAASFQETTKVLTEASINGKFDHLSGLKENVIMGRLIPAGTGFFTDQAFNYRYDGEEVVVPDLDSIIRDSKEEIETYDDSEEYDQNGNLIQKARETEKAGSEELKSEG